MHNPYFGARLDTEQFILSQCHHRSIPAAWSKRVPSDELRTVGIYIRSSMSNNLQVFICLHWSDSSCIGVALNDMSSAILPNGYVDRFNSLLSSILLVAGSNYLARLEPEGNFSGPALELSRSPRPLHVDFLSQQAATIHAWVFIHTVEFPFNKFTETTVYINSCVYFSIRKSPRQRRECFFF